MRKGSVFWVALLAMVLAGALACASDDPAPAPAGPSAEEIAQMVTNAVNSAMPAEYGRQRGRHPEDDRLRHDGDGHWRQRQ